MNNDKPTSVEDFIRDTFWPALSDHFLRERELIVEFKAMCDLNDVYSNALGLTQEEVKEAFETCLHKAKAEQLNKTLEQGDAA